MFDKQKIITELIVLGVFLLVVLVVLPRISKRGLKESVTEAVEAEQEAHLKRLFGPAWKEAKDL